MNPIEKLKSITLNRLYLSFVLIYFDFFFLFIKTFFIYILEQLNPTMESVLYGNITNVNEI